MIHPTRIHVLRGGAVPRGRYVLYWMQASQRVTYNHALEYAIETANDLRLPLVVFFGITDRFPNANRRHYAFMLEGLSEVQGALGQRGIQFVLRHISPERGALDLAREASCVVVDQGYLRIQRAWYDYIAQRINCPLIQVESNVVVPTALVSNKEEYAARTIRPKIHRLLPDYLRPLAQRSPLIPSTGLDIETLHLTSIREQLARLAIDHSVDQVASFIGGASQAEARLRDLIESKLERYADLRNDPSLNHVSHLSPYLHFGQISPLHVALEVKSAGQGADAFLEELIVRRELSMNMCLYNPSYDQYECVVPAWARKTLAAHRDDRRAYIYTQEQLEQAQTHDEYWNAAQQEMVLTGKMHGYMRMYWGKKIIEWSTDPATAFERALYLNDKYELDGRDPNGYTGVAWCFGKHDRPWQERPIFGTVRYMDAKGLERKFDIKAYVRRIKALLSSEGAKSKLGD